ANIEADAPRRIELEMVQGRGELYAAARHPWMLRLRNERRILENFLGRPAHNQIVCAHPPRRNRRLRPRPAFHDTPFNKKTVDAYAPRHESLEQTTRISC